MAKDLAYYLAQARRIASHREANAEKEIRKLYKAMLKDLQAFMADAYVKYAQGDQLTFAMLQQAGYDARFLEEIERHINVTTPKASKELRKLVEDTYKLAYEGMVEGVAKAGTGGLDAAFAEHVAITPQQIKAAVENPVYGLTLKDTLEKNRKEIIYSIKQTVGVGLMNGDRYTTMARRIAQQVDGDYKKAIRIARTEAHRVREAGNMAAAIEVDKELENGTTGMRMVKTWKSMKDERVRPQRRRKGKGGWSTKMGKGANHMILDGQTVLSTEPFDLMDGNKAMQPGQSGVAGHDINCRCYASVEMMTDAEYYSKTGKHFPGWQEPDAVAAKYGKIDGEHTIADDIGSRASPTCNPNFGKGGAYTINCQRCVQAYEFRRRGYSVTAKSKPTKNNTIIWGCECFTDAIGAAVQYVYNQTASQVKKAIGTSPDGSRFGIYVKWKGRSGSAHVFVAEKDNGVIRYVDPQNGNMDASNYFDRGSAGKFGYFRMDDKEITDDMNILEETMEASAK